jgi:hypothetical protein
MNAWLGLTASLVSHFFSREFCGKWDSVLAKISVLVSRVLGISLEGKNAIYCEAFESLNLRVSQFARLRNKQNQNSLGEISVRPKILARFSQDSRVKVSDDSCESRYEISVCKTHESRYKICLQDLREASLATKFLFGDSWVSLQNLSGRLARSKYCYKIYVCETYESCYKICLRDSREASLATKFLSARPVRSDSRYEISICETREQQVLLLILTREPHKNLARILGLKSESRFSREISKSDSRVNLTAGLLTVKVSSDLNHVGIFFYPKLFYKILY